VQLTEETEEASQVGPSAEELAEPAPGDVDADRSEADKAGEAANSANIFPCSDPDPAICP
jgi:hypothetical protein